MDHQKDHPGPGVDHLVKEAPFSAHMIGMSNVRMTLTAAAAAAVFLTAAPAARTASTPPGPSFLPRSGKPTKRHASEP